MSEKNPLLSFKDIRIEVEGKEIISGVSLDINKGEVHAIMGPNGSGRRSGHPRDGYR